MTNKSKKPIAIRLICFFLAAHMFNLSVDPQDIHSDSLPENLAINDIESFTELVAEIVFKKVDAFGEHDEKDNNDGGAFFCLKFYCSTHHQFAIQHPPLTTIKKFPVQNTLLIDSRVAQVTSPPPRKEKFC